MSLVAVFVWLNVTFHAITGRTDVCWCASESQGYCFCRSYFLFRVFSGHIYCKKTVYIQNRTANIWPKMNLVFLAVRSVFSFFFFSTCSPTFFFLFFIFSMTRSSYLKNFHTRSPSIAHTRALFSARLRWKNNRPKGALTHRVKTQCGIERHRRERKIRQRRRRCRHPRWTY